MMFSTFVRRMHIRKSGVLFNKEFSYFDIIVLHINIEIIV